MGAKKSLSARVQERAQRVSPAARNRAQIVALRHEIEQAMNDGWTLAMIWSTLQEEGMIQFGYETFRAHVRKLVRPLSETRPDSPPIRRGSGPVKQLSTGRLMGASTRASADTGTPATPHPPNSESGVPAPSWVRGGKRDQKKES